MNVRAVGASTMKSRRSSMSFGQSIGRSIGTDAADLIARARAIETTDPSGARVFVQSARLLARESGDLAHELCHHLGSHTVALT
ncbi:MAG: hypothetical protein ACKODY_11690, partial [Actinomycetota bacterium]